MKLASGWLLNSAMRIIEATLFCSPHNGWWMARGALRPHKLRHRNDTCFNVCLGRDYSDPQHALWWEKAQAAVAVAFPGGVLPPVVAALQLYSDKTQVNFKGGAAHPVRATLVCDATSCFLVKHSAHSLRCLLVCR